MNKLTYLDSKFSRRLVRVPLEDYFTEEGFEEFLPQLEDLRKYVTMDSKIRRGELDVLQRRGAEPGVRLEREAVITRNGYTNYQDRSTGKFYFELYSALKSIGVSEPKLLVNHANEFQESSIIMKRRDFRRQLPISDGLKALFQNFYRYQILNTPTEEVAIYVLSFSTISAPFCRINEKGMPEPYHPDDVQFGRADDIAFGRFHRVKRYYYQIKQSWFSKLEEIYYKQKSVDFLTLTPDNWLEYYFNSYVICAITRYRRNNIDSVTNADDAENELHRFITKDRKVAVLTPHGIRFGTLDIRKYSSAAIQRAHSGWGGSAQRTRPFQAAGNPANLPSAICSRLVTHKLERSINGFASTSELSVTGYNQFLQFCASRNGEFLFINGDRTNAETFVTSNFEQFLELFPQELRLLISNQSLVCNVGYANKDFVRPSYFTHGLNSGIARTTEFNWIMGTFEATLAIAKLTNNKHEEVVLRYFRSLLSEEPFFILGRFVIKLFMPTDDIPLIIFGPHIERPEQILGEGTGLMSWNCDTTEMRTFGMHFTKTGMSANAISPVSKLFYDEHPGFYAHSAFSLREKWKALPVEIRRVAGNVYRKAFSHDVEDVFPAALDFEKYLISLGVNIGEFINQYSPSEQIIYAKYVSEDAMNTPQRLSIDIIKPIADDIKDTVKNNVNNKILEDFNGC